jgi:predicted transcriptional regulator
MKKQSVAKQVLNLLNTKGGRKPKQIIAETKASAGSVYNALNLLRKKKMIAKEEDGVYISQTQTRVMPLYNEKASSPSTTNLLKENKQLTEWAQMWKQKHDRIEAEYTQAKIMYLDSQAVVKYLEEKVAQLIKG